MQTQPPIASLEQKLQLGTLVNECFSIDEAQQLVRMSRTGFFRFRGDYGIRTTFGRKIHGADIVRALGLARGQSGMGLLPTLREYAKKLMRPDEVCQQLGLGLTTLYTLRVRHHVPLLPGGTFNCDDIIAAFDAERRGERRPASATQVRVTTRVRKSRKAATAALSQGVPAE